MGRVSFCGPRSNSSVPLVDSRNAAHAWREALVRWQRNWANLSKPSGRRLPLGRRWKRPLPTFA
jgi:hypothetical protein